MFTQRRIATLVGTVATGAALSVAALASAGVASAASTDDSFLNFISQHGVGFSSPQGAIADAHRVCQYIANGNSPVSAVKEIQSDTNLTRDEAVAFVAASVVAYCPQYDSNPA
jgi:Protein of unknown function (DUF732)